MAPKRAQKMEVRSTTKVVQESVQVSVVSSNKRVTRGKNDIQIGEVTIQAKEDASITTITTADKAGQETKPNVPVQNETEEQKRDTDMGVNKEHVKKAKTQERNDGGKVKRKKKRGKRNGEGYQRYVYRVLKQVHPDMAISSKAMIVLNNLMNDMFERLAVEAAKLNTYTGHMTLSSREIQGAVKLVLPGELGKHAIAEGAKAVTNFISYDT